MTPTDSTLRLALRDLPRQLGSSRHLHLTWQVPEGLGTSMMAVEEGTPLDLDVTLTSVDDGVLVDVDTTVEMVGECVRCLDPVCRTFDVEAEDVYFEPHTGHSKHPGDDPESGDEDEVRTIGEHDTVDLEALLRDTIVPLAEDRPLCRADCAGLCPVCGEKLDELGPDHHHDVIDPRLAGLAALLEADAPEED